MAEREFIKLDDYPSNSHSSKEIEEKKVVKEKKVERVVKGKVVRKKKSIGQRLGEAFLGEETGNVGEYILYDVLIPAAKDTISDAVKGGLDMVLFGERRSGPNHTRRDRGRSYVSYRSYYDDRDDRRPAPRNRKKNDFEDIILDSRQEAEEVISGMVDLIDEYETASVADLYEMVGIDAKYTDGKWGWDNLSSAYVERVRQGYYLHLPRPILIG